MADSNENRSITLLSEPELIFSAETLTFKIISPNSQFWARRSIVPISCHNYYDVNTHVKFMVQRGDI